MGEDFSKNFFVSSVVSDLFTVESQLCSTGTADLYKAFDRERGRPVAVWMLRDRIETDSPLIYEFTKRLGKLSLQGAAVARILTAGVDPSGVVFAVISPVDGYPILGGNIDAVEAERRFLAICRIVEQLHIAGIYCGDLCHTSFWVSRNGDIQFIGIMGAFEDESNDGAVPPLETLNFLAPESTPGSAVKATNDVFSLGALGYMLFTKAAPFPNPATKGASPVIPARSLNPMAPLWVDEVFQKCMDLIPTRRYGTAGALVAAILAAKEHIAKEQSSIKTRDAGAMVERNPTDGSVVTFKTGETAEDIPDGKIESGTSTKRLLVVGAVLSILLAVLFVGGVLVYKNFVANKQSPTETALEVHKEASDDRMRRAIDVVNDMDAALTDKRIKFQELQQSDDPLAHDILVRSAVDGENPKVRILAEQSILARARRLSFELPAGVVGNWLSVISVDHPPAEYEPALKAVNPTIPSEGRKELLRKVFQLNPDLAQLLIASMVLSAGNPKEYDVITAELYGAALKVDIPPKISAIALLTTVDAVYREFREQVLNKLTSVSPEDLLWTLEMLIRKGSTQMSTIASALISKNIFKPLKLVYLEPLRDNDTLPEGIPLVLLRALRGDISKGDVEALGMWLDQSAEYVLLAICAEDIAGNLKTEAVEYLAGRGIGNQPQGGFVEWIKRSAWDSRDKLAEPLGVTALSSRLELPRIRSALQKLEGFSKDGSLFSILFQAPDPRFIAEVLDMYRSVIPAQSVVTLLAHPSKDVRLAAIQSLKDVNQVGALNAIIELYNAEVDPEVRKAYSDNLWVIKQRLEGK